MTSDIYSTALSGILGAVSSLSDPKANATIPSKAGHPHYYSGVAPCILISQNISHFKYVEDLFNVYYHLSEARILGFKAAVIWGLEAG